MSIKLCLTCHIEKPITEFAKAKTGKYGVSAKCKECRSLYHKEWYEQNKQKRLIQCKQYREENTERILLACRIWRKSNRDYCRTYQNQYFNTEFGKAVKKASEHNRRTHKLNNGGKHTAKQILELFDLQSASCPYCETKLYKSGANKYHVDHIMPLSKGGSNDINNIQLLCAPCNLSKHNKLPKEFAAQFNKFLKTLSI